MPNDKEEALSLAISEANKSSNSIIEKAEQWFDFVKIRLAEVNHIINIDYLVTGTEAPPVGAKVSTASTEVSSSVPTPVPSAAPLPSGGKYTPLTPAMRTLEWGYTPTSLHT